MIDTLVLKVIGIVLAIVLAAGGLYAGYSHIKNTGHKEGYEEAKVLYEKQITEYRATVETKITNIETLSNTLAAENRASNEAMSKDIGDILTKVKGKTLTVVKNGECTPNQTFSDTFVTVNKRANQAIKDSQK